MIVTSYLITSDFSEHPKMSNLHIFFFPLMAHGHMLPTIDMAKLFSSRGLKTTLITTNHHAAMFNRAIESSVRSGLQISVRSVRFPAAEVGMPEGVESLDLAMSLNQLDKFSAGIALLREPLESLLREFRPDCLVSDIFLPFTADAAEKFGIPRLCFHGSSSFITSVSENIRRYKPYRNVMSDSVPFLLPDFPHRIELTRAEIPESMIEEGTGPGSEPESDFSKLLAQISDANARSFGYIINSFYELEHDYVQYNREKFGIRAWNIGPMFLQINDEESQRGKESSIDHDKCLSWLDSKDPSSVVYVCFGSLAGFTATHLHEIGSGLEKSGHNFIWVVKNCDDEDDDSRWFPDGFEQRIEGKGLIIKGWAPQLLILDHESVGSFVTHCGWNSVLEGLCSGKTMVTCPLFGDQFFNEKLLVEVLRIGVSVGARQNSLIYSGVNAESLAAAVDRVMVGAEAVEMRKRANVLKEMAMKAVKVGGSTDLEFHALIQDLRACKQMADNI